MEGVWKYAKDQKKFAGLLYGALLKDFKKNITGGSYLEIGAGPGLLATMITEANLQVDVNDKCTIQGLGKYDLVYSTFSLHHWKDPVKFIGNLWEAVCDNGKLYIYDLKRVWWLYYLPLKGGDIGSIRASYTPPELRKIIQKVGLSNYDVKSFFPFFKRLIIFKT
jgi:hypothetical protein